MKPRKMLPKPAHTAAHTSVLHGAESSSPPARRAATYACMPTTKPSITTSRNSPRTKRRMGTSVSRAPSRSATAAAVLVSSS